MPERGKPTINTGRLSPWLAFGKRSADELFECENDPHQLTNVADDPKYAAIKKKLADQLMAELKATKDPRALGKGDVFDTYPYLGGGVRKRPPKKKPPPKKNL